MKREKQDIPTVKVYFYPLAFNLTKGINYHVAVTVSLGGKTRVCDFNSSRSGELIDITDNESIYDKPDIIKLTPPPHYSNKNFLRSIEEFLDHLSPLQYQIQSNNCATVSARFLKEVLGYSQFQANTILPSVVADQAKQFYSVKHTLAEIKKHSSWCPGGTARYRTINHKLDSLFNAAGELADNTTWQNASAEVSSLYDLAKKPRNTLTIFSQKESSSAGKLRRLSAQIQACTPQTKEITAEEKATETTLAL